VTVTVDRRAGRLAAQGQASVASDALVLSIRKMNNSAVLYIQGTSIADGAGSAFGDGLR